MTDRSSAARIKDVAALAGVSTATVSRYINDPDLVSPLTGERIEKAISESGFMMNMSARSLKTQNSKMVVLAVPDIENPFYSKMAATAQRLLQAQDYVMLLYNTRMSTYDSDGIRLARQLNASGILIATIEFGNDLLDLIQRFHIPTVGLNAYREGLPFDAVHTEGFRGTYLTASHLISLGHKKIYFAGGKPDSMIGISREEGYLKAMKEAGIDIAEDYIFREGFTQEDGLTVGTKIASSSQLPTAICCANDQLALGVIGSLRRKGIRIPEDISVTGMDDIPYASTSWPSLTTATNDSVRFTSEGINMLLDRLNGTYTGTPRDIVIQHELIIRDSTIPCCPK